MVHRKDLLDKLQKDISYQFQDVELLHKAMTHSSLTPQGLKSYERLEFVGDAVVGLVVSEHLFRSPSRWSEGEMTAMKSDVVNRVSMAAAGQRLSLKDYLRVDRSLEKKESYPPSLIAEAYEALVGAIFLDGGFQKAQEFALRTLELELVNAEQRKHPPNFKSVLQQLVQAQGEEPPAYRTVAKIGPDHDSRFRAAVYIGGTEMGSGWARTKKEAEQKAAEAALERLRPDWMCERRDT